MLGKFYCRLHVRVNLWHWNMIKLGVKQGKIGHQAVNILQIVVHCLWLKKCKMVSVFTSGYVNTETILHFFYKITDERGMKTVFTYAHVKWFYGQSEGAYYLNYFIINDDYVLWSSISSWSYLWL